jgi:hypothetical protein
VANRLQKESQVLLEIKERKLIDNFPEPAFRALSRLRHLSVLPPLHSSQVSTSVFRRDMQSTGICGISVYDLLRLSILLH